MTYRDDVAALAARQASLAQEVAGKQRELAEATRLLADAHARAHLPILDNIRVASPCKASWDGMTGDDRVRHCGDCKKNVYNLSNLTRDQAHELIAHHNGGLCVRYYLRADGTILLADCEVGQRRRFRKQLLIAGATVAGLAGAAGAVARTVMLSEPEEEPEIVMGEMRIELPERLTTSMIDQAMTPARAELAACATAYATNDAIRARVTVRADGLVNTVSLIDTPESPLGDCVGHRIHQIQFQETELGGTFIYPITSRR